MADQETCICEHCGEEVIDPLLNYCICTRCGGRGCCGCMDFETYLHNDECQPRPPFTAVSELQEVTYHTAEHEVFLSFNDDDGAVAFNEWWVTEGARVFNEWLKTSDQWSRLAEGPVDDG